MIVLDKYESMVYASDMVGNRLRDILTREGVTAYRLWKDLGINQGQLSRFFKGVSNISLDKLEQIADYLGYDITFVKRKHPRKGGK
jgi:transcriptional regulator with XRE-family HTH domain